MGEFGPNGKMNADVAGAIWSFSDENDPSSVKEDHMPETTFTSNGPNNMTYPTAAFARGVDQGGLPMLTEIYNRHRVDLFWPGTGPMTDVTERAALKDLYENIELESIQPNRWGNTAIFPGEFVADDSIDPCSNNGQGKRLMSVTCIGGHVVSLYFDYLDHLRIKAFPASISKLVHLRHIWGLGNGWGAYSNQTTVIPCEFGQLANLKALVLMKSTAREQRLEFPADSCMNGLVRLQEVMLGAFEMNRFPATFLQLPEMRKVSVTRAPLALLPATLSPTLRVLKLSDTGASGPLPSFKGSALLTEVYLNDNNLELGSPDAFDNCPNLKNIDVSNNKLSTAVFRFAGSTKLETIELSHNLLHGGFPQSWAELKTCKVVRATHNLLSAPFDPLSSMVKTEVVAMGHNRLAWNPAATGLAAINFRDFLFTLLPAKIASFDISYNLLKQPFRDSSFDSTGLGTNGARYPDLLNMDISHNQLWGFVDLDLVFYNYDMSYNNLTSISLATVSACCTGKLYNRQMFSLDWRHQMSEQIDMFTGSSWGTGILAGMLGGIDRMLTSEIDFKTVEFMPRHDSFEQVWRFQPRAAAFRFLALHGDMKTNVSSYSLFNACIVPAGKVERNLR
jgi:hypothetical protein